ncbi:MULTISPECIES: molybdopterin-dependent oxidoreductase [Gordonibacter]|uniref:Molybdopterin-dependent oxidoreductase n=1 Tax=Gordonibacter faecis TaxID=3047475 RepID=A0ABT7DPS1_9ACTN|nr:MULTISPECIES: molybdopterin-dependent oxidoreductase [unclassified Gordonibacter]MDJ1651549.1 molybdopterin-dependent oxidoreductase [Gordonibacter sp. KGMB12511]
MSEERTVYKSTGMNSFGIGANVAEVDVADDRIVRVRPMRYDKEYSADYLKPWTIKARGSEFHSSMKALLPPYAYAYKKRIYSKNRILYPYKRIDWDPRGERHPENRGKSKFVRISWDEAATLIADEITRVKDTYGLPSVFIQGDGHGETKVVHASHGCATRLMNVLGDDWTYQARQPDSWEGWYWGAKHMWGQDPLGQFDMGNLLLDIAENTDMLVFCGCDMETTTWGWQGQIPSQYCFWLTEIGVKQVYICPDLNYGAAVHADKWIPVLPNTDAALMAAVAYVWMTEGTYDKEYLASHAVGFDWFEYYISGKEDGQPKTPEWAAPICGVPSRQIKALAHEWAKRPTSMAHGNGGSFIRSCYSHEPARFEVALMTMQGLGKPGRNVVKFIEWYMYGLPSQQPAPCYSSNMTVGAAYRGWDFVQTKSFITKTLVPEAILGDYTYEHPLTWQGYTVAGWPREDQYKTYQYPIPGAQGIHMIWTDTPCWTTCWNGGNRMIEALRSEKIECVVAQQPWFENDCLFADILLPINTKYEERDIGQDNGAAPFGLIYLEEQAVKPLGESKSDWEAVGEVAKKLGVYDEYVEGRSLEEWIQLGFESAEKPLDLSFDEFKEKGYLAAPTRDDWEELPRGFELFYKDPEGHPLSTPTGKVEFYATALAEHFPDDDERPPVPHFIPYGRRHQESLLHPRSEEYPFLIVSNHPRWRIHANMDDIPWLREIPTCKVTGPDGYKYEPVWINPQDAAERGIEDGDVVRLYNDRGWVLGGAVLTERIRPSVVYQDHGARVDPIEPGVSDRGGANNLIAPNKTTSQNAPGEVTSGFLVNIEKVDVFELAQQYPEAFGRAYDADEGVEIMNWIQEA